MVAEVIDTVPPDATVDLKLSEPEPTAASPSIITVDVRAARRRS